MQKWQVVGHVSASVDPTSEELASWEKRISDSLMTAVRRQMGEHGHYEGDPEPIVTTWHDPTTDCYKVKATLRAIPIVISRPIFIISDNTDGWTIRFEINSMMYGPWPPFRRKAFNGNP